MDHTIINIGRSFGSGGGFVAKAVGEKLGIPVFDNELISRYAEENGYSKGAFAQGEEKPSIFSLSSFFSSGRPSFAEGGGYVNDNMMFRIQSEVIRCIAEKGDAIIIGRCSDYILREMNCLDVFISAPEQWRIERLARNEKLSLDEAEALMKENARIRRMCREAALEPSRLAGLAAAGGEHIVHVLKSRMVQKYAGET